MAQVSPGPGESQELSREIHFPLTSAGSTVQLTEVYNSPLQSSAPDLVSLLVSRRLKKWPNIGLPGTVLLEVGTCRTGF